LIIPIESSPGCPNECPLNCSGGISCEEPAYDVMCPEKTIKNCVYPHLDDCGMDCFLSCPTYVQDPATEYRCWLGTNAFVSMARSVTMYKNYTTYHIAKKN